MLYLSQNKNIEFQSIYKNKSSALVMKKPYLIDKIGINHNGSFQMVEELVLLAKNYKFNVCL